MKKKKQFIRAKTLIIRLIVLSTRVEKLRDPKGLVLTPKDHYNRSAYTSTQKQNGLPFLRYIRFPLRTMYLQNINFQSRPILSNLYFVIVTCFKGQLNCCRMRAEIFRHLPHEFVPRATKTAQWYEHRAVIL